MNIGNSRSLSLDLYDQVENLDKTSQFRFTPPTHTILAFKQALAEFWKEGGVEGRANRLANIPTVSFFNFFYFLIHKYLAMNHLTHLITDIRQIGQFFENSLINLDLSNLFRKKTQGISLHHTYAQSIQILASNNSILNLVTRVSAPIFVLRVY